MDPEIYFFEKSQSWVCSVSSHGSHDLLRARQYARHVHVHKQSVSFFVVCFCCGVNQFAWEQKQMFYLLPGNIQQTLNHPFQKSSAWKPKKRNTGVPEKEKILCVQIVCDLRWNTLSRCGFCFIKKALTASELLFCCRKDSCDSKPAQIVKRHSADFKPDRQEGLTQDAQLHVSLIGENEIIINI